MRRPRFEPPKPKPKDFRKWSTWYNVARDLAVDYGVRGVSKRVYRALFDQGLSPSDAAARVGAQT